MVRTEQMMVMAGVMHNACCGTNVWEVKFLLIRTIEWLFRGHR